MLLIIMSSVQEYVDLGKPLDLTDKALVDFAKDRAAAARDERDENITYSEYYGHPAVSQRSHIVQDSVFSPVYYPFRSFLNLVSINNKLYLRLKQLALTQTMFFFFFVKLRDCLITGGNDLNVNLCDFDWSTSSPIG